MKVNLKLGDKVKIVKGVAKSDEIYAVTFLEKVDDSNEC